MRDFILTLQVFVIAITGQVFLLMAKKLNAAADRCNKVCVRLHKKLIRISSEIET